MTVDKDVVSEISRRFKPYFPITSINDILIIFHDIIQPYFPDRENTPKDIGEIVANLLKEIFKNNTKRQKPDIDLSNDRLDIGFLSLLLGWVEFKLTCSSFKSSSSGTHSRQRHKDLLSQPLSVETSEYAQSTSNGSSPSLGNAGCESPCALSSISTPSMRKRKRPRRASGTSSLSRQRKRNDSGLSAPEKMTEKIYVNTADSGVISDHSSPSINFPQILLEDLVGLYEKIYQKFSADLRIKPFIETRRKKGGSLIATKDLIKTICDIIRGNIVYHKGVDKWNHSQTLFSFINSNTLDGFGLAITVYSVCEMFQFSNVWLSLSEEYAWIDILSPDDSSVISLDVSRYIYEKSEDIQVSAKNLSENWLYLKGISVTSRTQPLLPLAAIVASIQPNKDASLVGLELPLNRCTNVPIPEEPELETEGKVPGPASPTQPFQDWVMQFSPVKKYAGGQATPFQMLSHRMVDLKQRLLWLLQSRHLLSEYPVGLSNLADLEEGFPTPINPELLPYKLEIDEGDLNNTSALHNRIMENIYQTAVDANSHIYDNKQVYPYLNLANSYCKRNETKKALEYWSIASTIVSQYNHGNEDTEVYKELLEIATITIPTITRSAYDNLRFGPTSNEKMAEYLSSLNILDDPECFSYIISFIDGLCVWEQDSDVPVLHIGWVDKLMQAVLRFSPKAASCVDVDVIKGPAKKYTQIKIPTVIEKADPVKSESKPEKVEMSSQRIFETSPLVSYETGLYSILDDLRIPMEILFSKEASDEDHYDGPEEAYLDYLVNKSQTRLLNLNHLLGLEPDIPFLSRDMIKKPLHSQEKKLKEHKNPLLSGCPKIIKIEDGDDENQSPDTKETSSPERIKIIIRSQKMESIANLWKNLSSKQNVSAIKLALTAQINRGAGQTSDANSTQRTTRRSTILANASSNNR